VNEAEATTVMRPRPVFFGLEAEEGRCLNIPSVLSLPTCSMERPSSTSAKGCCRGLVREGVPLPVGVGSDQGLCPPDKISSL